MTLPAFAFPRENEVKLSGERDKIALLRHDGETIPFRGLTAVFFKCFIERIGKESSSAMQKLMKRL
jgi:hypothetical protein